MDAIPFLIPIAVFVALGLIVKIAVLRQMRHISHEDKGSKDR